MVKLSQQLATQEENKRVTRTERVIAKRDYEKAKAEQERQDALYKQAEAIRGSQFTNISSVEDYAERYENLSPDIKPFFQTPEKFKETAQSDPEYQEYQSAVKKQRLKEKALKMWKDRVPYGLVGGSEVYPYLRNLWKRYGSYSHENIMKAKSEDQAQKLQSYVDAGYKAQVLTEYSVEDGKEIMKKSIVYGYVDDKGKLYPVAPMTLQTADTSTYTPSSVVGKQSIPIQFEIAGQKYEFKTTQQVYKDEGGKLYTGYGELGMTESEYSQKIEDAKNEAVAEYLRDLEQQEKTSARNYGTDYSGSVVEFYTKPEEKEKEKKAFLSNLFGGIQTGLSMYGGKKTSNLYSEDMINKALSKENYDVTADVLKSIYNKYDYPVYWNYGVGGLALSPYKLYPSQQPIGEQFGEIMKWNEETSMGIKEKTLKDIGATTYLESEAQQEYQLRFEKKYGENILRGNISYEEAEAEYKLSDEAKLINVNYQKKMSEAWRTSGVLKLDKAEVVGLEILNIPNKLFPKTTGQIALTTGAVWVGSDILKATPVWLGRTASVGLIGYETYEALNPLKQPEQRLLSGVMAGIGIGYWGYQGTKYLRSNVARGKTIPMTKTPSVQHIEELEKNIVIKKPVAERLKDATGEVVGTRTKSASMKLTEQTSEGYRMTISKQWRRLLGLEPEFKGIPYVQQGDKIIYEDVLRGTSVTVQEQSAYQRALADLQTRGTYLYTDKGYKYIGILDKKNAMKLLRYTAPVKEVSFYTADVYSTQILGNNPQIVVKHGVRDIYKSVEVVDAELGIKTRGGRAVREYISGKGEIVFNTENTQISRMTYEIEKTYLTSEGFPYQLTKDAGKTKKLLLQTSISSKQGSGVLELDVYKGNKLIDSGFANYDTYINENYVEPLAPKGKPYSADTGSMIFDRKSFMIDKYLDVDVKDLLRNKLSVMVKPKPKVVKAGIVTDSNYFKDLYAEEKKISFGNVVKSSGKYPDVPASTPASAFENVNLGDSWIQQATTSQQLISDVPALAPLKGSLRSLMAVQKESSALKYLLGSQLLKQQDMMVGQQLKQDSMMDLKQIKIPKLLQDIKQSVALKSDVALKQNLNLKSANLNANISVPSISNPRIPSFEVPVIPQPQIPIIPIPIPENLLRQVREKQKRKKKITDLSYLPDFTARTLGLEAVDVQMKDVEKLIKKTQSGIDIRRALKIK